MTFDWFSSNDERVRDGIISLLTKKPLSLPVADDFKREVERLQPRRPATDGHVDRFTKSFRRQRVAKMRTSSNRPKQSPVSDDSSALSKGLSELTLTYITVVRRCEDFNRRAMIKDEFRYRSHLQKLMDEFQAIIPSMLSEWSALSSSEKANRYAIDREHEDEMLRIANSEAAGMALARRREGSRPKCYVLSKGKGSMIPDSACERSFIELTWRGGVDLTLVVVVMDHRGTVVGVATNGEGVRTKGRLMLVRPLNDYDGNCGNGVGGSHMTFQLNLSGCPVNVSKFVFCVCPRASSESLTSLKQCWLTISDLDPQTETSRQLLTVHVAPLRFYGCAVVASLRRREESLWQYFNDSNSILGHRRPGVIAQLLGEEFSNRFLFIDREVAFVHASLELVEVDARDALERTLLETIALLEVQLCCDSFKDATKRFSRQKSVIPRRNA